MNKAPSGQVIGEPGFGRPPLPSQRSRPLIVPRALNWACGVAAWEEDPWDREGFVPQILSQVCHKFVASSGCRCWSRGRKSTRPGVSGVVELSPFEFLDRLADLVPPPRKHRHRYHGVFAPNHKLRSAVTALAIGNVGKPRDAATGGHAVGGHAADGDATCHGCDSCDKLPSHDTSRIAWAKLMARVGEEFPLECPGCGGDIRLIAFITDPGPIRKILTHLGESLEPPPVSPARGPPTDWGELVQVHDECDVTQTSPDELPVIDIRSL